MCEANALTLLRGLLFGVCVAGVAGGTDTRVLMHTSVKIYTYHHIPTTYWIPHSCSSASASRLRIPQVGLAARHNTLGREAVLTDDDKPDSTRYTNNCIQGGTAQTRELATTF